MEPAKSESQENSSNVKIMVCDPVVKDGINKYVIYSIRGNDNDGSFEVFRRYSDFNTLRKTMVKRWPGCFVPPIPEKKAVGNMDSKFIEDRRKKLEEFCFKIANLPHLYNSDEFKIFLRQTNIDLEKALNALPEVTTEELIKKYELNFSQLSGKEINTDIVIKITAFQNYVKKIISMLKNFKEIAKKTSNARKVFNDQFSTFSNYLLPEYEKNCLIEYIEGDTNQFIFNKPENENGLSNILASLKDNYKKNSFEDFNSLLKSEIRDIEAFQDGLNQKANYEGNKNKLEVKLKDAQLEMQKILAGKTTISSIFSKGSKDEKISNLEKQISSFQNEISNLQFLCDIITVILGYIDIDRFKNEKKIKYFKIIKFMAQSELNYTKIIEEYWGAVASNSILN